MTIIGIRLSLRTIALMWSRVSLIKCLSLEAIGSLIQLNTKSVGIQFRQLIQNQYLISGSISGAANTAKNFLFIDVSSFYQSISDSAID